MKQRKSVIALLLIAIIGVVGLTFAYFSNSDTIENNFITKEYGSTYTEEFVSPDNWLPGDTTNKTVVATNTGQVDQAVRIHVTEAWTTHNNGTLNGWIHPDGTKSTHETNAELETDERVAIINLANTSDWTKVGDYYYYNYKLVPGKSTTSFIESVTFNSKTKLDNTCVTTEGNGTKTITCNSSGDDYDNATYSLTFTIDTVQYNQYRNAWNTNFNIYPVELATKQLLDDSTNPSGTEYNNTSKTKMFTFAHSATENTPALTDYRYIGDNPNNYVYFNCADINDTSTCEIWRIIGVFDVDDGTGNYQQRVKLLRGSEFPDKTPWNLDGEEAGVNDWTEADIQVFLNGDYYNKLNDGSSIGLSKSARNMIADAKFYLGGQIKVADVHVGTAEDMYKWEKGTLTFDNSRPTEWTGKVGLMYPSDSYYTYANGVDDICYNDSYVCANGHPSSSWIFNSNIRQGENTIEPSTYFISPGAGYSVSVFRQFDTGNLESGFASGLYGIRPVVYLKNNVTIVSGTGNESNPYILSEVQ